MFGIACTTCVQYVAWALMILITAVALYLVAVKTNFFTNLGNTLTDTKEAIRAREGKFFKENYKILLCLIGPSIGFLVLACAKRDERKNRKKDKKRRSKVIKT